VFSPHYFIQDILGKETNYRTSCQVVADAISHKIRSMHNLGLLANKVILERKFTKLPFDSRDAVKVRNRVQMDLPKLSLLDLVSSCTVRHLVTN
jgi:hypothetical protein